MRKQPVNWFFLVLSLSDLTVLIASFFVFSVPVYAEIADDIDFIRSSSYLIIWFYPLAQTGLTMSVYLTVLVSVHRYLGVCHPFLIRRISNSTGVKLVIASAVLFAFLFNTSRWFELTTMPCLSNIHRRESLVVIPTELMVDGFYTVVYRNGAYTLVMFFFPFAILTFVNLRIIGTLRNSYKMRRQMTMHPRKKKDVVPSTAETISSINGNNSSSVTTNVLIQQNGTAHHSGSSQANDRKENGVTVMLVAITTEFLAFNLLAFANNILELTGAFGQSALETLLVEVSALLVNINGASTIIIYMIFSSKYRNVFLRIVARIGTIFCGERKLSFLSGIQQFETTQLIDSKLDQNDTKNWKSSRRSNGDSVYKQRASQA
ncbi:unnamed protein product [Auanema sp. JU1783]|nr:unnamed protein product [Auanema sp. JU1783]